MQRRRSINFRIAVRLARNSSADEREDPEVLAGVKYLEGVRRAREGSVAEDEQDPAILAGVQSELFRRARGRARCRGRADEDPKPALVLTADLAGGEKTEAEAKTEGETEVYDPIEEEFRALDHALGPDEEDEGISHIPRACPSLGDLEGSTRFEDDYALH